MKTGQRILIFVAVLAFIGCAGQSKDQSTAPPEAQIYVQDVKPLSPRLEMSSATCPKNEIWKTHTWQKLMAEANACFLAKNYHQTENIANQMAILDLLSPWGPFYLSLVAEQSGDMNRAIWMIDLAEKKAPKNAVIIYQKGKILFALGETAKSVETLRKAVKLDPKFLEANLALGHIYYRERYSDEALPYFEAALLQDPKNYPALIAAAETLLQKGQYLKAADYLSQAQNLTPNKTSLRLQLALLQEENLKDLPAALDSYRKIKSLDKKKRLDEPVAIDVDSKIKKLEAQIIALAKSESTTSRGPSSENPKKQVIK